MYSLSQGDCDGRLAREMQAHDGAARLGLTKVSLCLGCMVLVIFPILSTSGGATPLDHAVPTTLPGCFTAVAGSRYFNYSTQRGLRLMALFAEMAPLSVTRAQSRLASKDRGCGRTGWITARPTGSSALPAMWGCWAE